MRSFDRAASGLWVPHMRGRRAGGFRNYGGRAPSKRPVAGGGGEGGDPSPTGVVFHSDWSTGTGQGDDALRDTDKTNPWTQTTSVGEQEVVSATGLGFPAGITNVMRNHYNQPSPTNANVEMHDMIAEPMAVDSHLYGRHYLRFDVDTDDATPGDLNHPVISQNGGGNYQWMYRVLSATTWQLVFQVTQGASIKDRVFYLGTDNSGANATPLDKDTVYRLEWHVHYENDSPEEWALELRVYDNGNPGTLLYDNEDFHNNQGDDLAAYQATGDNALVFLPSVMGSIIAESSSGAGSGQWTPTTDSEYTYYGAFVYRTDDWPGPYADGI